MFIGDFTTVREEKRSESILLSFHEFQSYGLHIYRVNLTGSFIVYSEISIFNPQIKYFEKIHNFSMFKNTVSPPRTVVLVPKIQRYRQSLFSRYWEFQYWVFLYCTGVSNLTFIVFVVLSDNKRSTDMSREIVTLDLTPLVRFFFAWKMP